MMDFLFFVKTFLVCMIITLALQVRFDELTLEQHTKNFITHSALVSPLQGVANGGAQLIRDLSKKVYNSIRGNSRMGGGHEAHGERASSFSSRRGPASAEADAPAGVNADSMPEESAH